MNNKLKKFMCLILTFVLAFTLSGELPAIADSGETIISVPITVQEEYDLASDFFTLLNQKMKVHLRSFYRKEDIRLRLIEMKTSERAQEVLRQHLRCGITL